jgi:hypothetical protein
METLPLLCVPRAIRDKGESLELKQSVQIQKMQQRKVKHQYVKLPEQFEIKSFKESS